MAFAYGMGHAGFGLGFLNFLGTVLFILAVIWLIRFAARGWRFSNGGPRSWRHGPPWTRHSHRGSGGEDDDALRTARERLAKGEIDAEQYETIRQGLETDGAKASSDDPREMWRAWMDKGRNDPALGIARERFARGEIDRATFESIRDALTG